MKAKELMNIVDKLMEMNCLVLYFGDKYKFIYKNYAITLSEHNIWLGESCYTYSQYNIGKDFYDKVRRYARREIDINNLKGLVERDYRKQKLERINEL